jgi:nucleoside-diphosphate-sugar epimerase
MAEATKDCAVVFHCAYGSYGSQRDQREITVKGTQTLANAAAINKVGTFINLSSFVVCGPNTPHVVDETYVPRQKLNWSYAVDKRDAELELSRISEKTGLTVVNFRPPTVYGPWGPAFTIYPLTTLASHRMALVGDGEGQSNALYVDDMVQSMLRAAVVPHTGFETYLVSGPDSVTWRQFYSAYCDMLGVDRLVALPAAEHRRVSQGSGLSQLMKVIPAAGRALARDPEFRRVAGRIPLSRRVYAVMKRSSRAGPGVGHAPAKLVSEPLDLITLPPIMVDYYASSTRVSHQKAVERLGYRPQYDLASGMALVRGWAEWARLV